MKFSLLALASVMLTVVCWGMYGPVLHKGQLGMEGSRLRSLLCVGFAYFVIAVIVPGIWLYTTGEQGRWTFTGIVWSLAGGAAGAIGALGIIMAFNFGGTPAWVMPMVFGCAPVVNAFLSMYMGKVTEKPSPIFLAGLVIVALGAVMTLLFAPKPTHHKPPAATAAESITTSHP